MTTTKVKIAGLTLTKMGELSPQEETWLAENSRAKQLQSMKNRYQIVKAFSQSKYIQGKEQGEEDSELLALTIMQTPPVEQSPAERANLEMVYLRMADSDSYPEESKDDELEFLTFMIQTRSNQKNWTYQKTKLLGAEKQLELWAFINAEMAGETPNEPVIDPLEPNSEDSAEQPTANQEMSAITG
jgi:hypothetical protein